jgi:AsmA-like C-terminal region
MRLQTQYDAVVNGLNGDTTLNSVLGSFLHTRMNVRGAVAGTPGGHGKTASLDFASQGARIENLLEMFVSDNRPSMSGPIEFRARVTLPPEHEPFLRKLQLDGDFSIRDARFNSPATEANVTQLSERARGRKNAIADPAQADEVLSNVRGRVSVRQAVATFPAISFEVPGARATGHGTYDLISEKIDLHGTLTMEAELSEASTGFKSVLLKPLNRFFKKKYAGSEVGVHLTGTYRNPSFGTSLTGRK